METEEWGATVTGEWARGNVGETTQLKCGLDEGQQEPRRERRESDLGFLDWEKEEEKGGEKERSVLPSEVRQGAEWPREEFRIFTKLDSLKTFLPPPPPPPPPAAFSSTVEERCRVEVE